MFEHVEFQLVGKRHPERSVLWVFGSRAQNKCHQGLRVIKIEFFETMEVDVII